MLKTSYKIVLIMSLLLITLPICMAEEAVSEKMADWTHAKSIDEQSITWVGYYNTTMNWGDKIDINDWALGNFTMELTDLMKDATGSKIIGALMTITGENKKSQVAIGSGESQTVNFNTPFDNEMKISATINGERTWSREIMQPNVSVQVFLRGKPDINLSSNIYTENPESGTDINTTDNVNSNTLFYIQIYINNIGNDTLRNAQLDVDLTNFTIPQEQLSVQRGGMDFKYIGHSLIYNLNDLKFDDSKNITLEIVSPMTPVNKTFNIPLILTGNDNKNVAYTFRSSEQFVVTPFIEIKKEIGPYFNYSGTDVLYVGESFFTDLNIKNHGNRDLAINLTDSIPDSFEYQTNENKSLNWSITIPAVSSRTITYYIKPVRYKETEIIPKATAVFEFDGKKYDVVSNDIEVKVIGADVLLTKHVTINQQNYGILNATITINARNLGDQRVVIKMNDTLPDNSSLINGTISEDNIFLDNGESYSYAYEISTPLRERIILPPAKGYFVDFRSYIEKDSSKKEDFWNKIESNQPVIETRQTAPVITPANVSQKPENITQPFVKKEDRRTKLEILRDFILELISPFTGKTKIEESKPVSRQAIQPTVKRIEETQSSFTWTLGWESQVNANASGGTWKASDTPGSRVSVSFIGTCVTLLYAANPGGGIANIELDGKGYPDIDMYSLIPESGIKRTIASGIENARHTLTITVSNARNPSSSNSLVVVDAVEITEPGIT
ncbi:Uncharacterised protein [uncultured archaeon]|nr:Uncharacterised protein [uncultured archaeon]